MPRLTDVRRCAHYLYRVIIVQRSEKWLWIIAVLLFGIAITTAGYKYKYSRQKLLIVDMTLDASCNLHKGACGTTQADIGSVSLSILPRSIPLVEPLHIVVRTNVKGIRYVAVDFRGVDMDMGYNRFLMKSVGNGEYQGGGMLPVCVRTHMRWEARVLIQRADDIVSAPYRFETKNHLQ